MDSLQILIKYHVSGMTPIEQTSLGNWIDLRSAEDIQLRIGDERLISLGISMKLPDGYEGHVIPRSSTFKNFGILQWNHFGVIDNNFCGENDIWKFTALAWRDSHIKFNDRICQFRIMPIQPRVFFMPVERMEDKDRSGFGSTGIK